MVRFAELDRWVTEEDYETILGGKYLRREDDPQVSVTDEIKAGAKSYQDSWNRTSDPFVGLVKGFAESAAGAGASLFSGLFGSPGRHRATAALDGLRRRAARARADPPLR